MIRLREDVKDSNDVRKIIRKFWNHKKTTVSQGFLDSTTAITQCFSYMNAFRDILSEDSADEVFTKGFVDNEYNQLRKEILENGIK